MTAHDRLYLDHAATTPMLPQARAAMIDGMGNWANPSSPHADGRAARAMLEDARARIGAALGWSGEILFTSGASEAIAIALTRCKASRVVTSAVEHDSVLRVTQGAERLSVSAQGLALLPVHLGGEAAQSLYAIQHVNNETGVIQPLDALADAIHEAGGLLFADCAQSVGKLPLPPADMMAISAHKFGGPPGIGALLVRDLACLHPSGGQEQGYRAGTENLPAVLAMAAALEASTDWLARAAILRDALDGAVVEAGGVVIAHDGPRIATIASYRLPGVSARAQLIQCDMDGISVSAGSACSSGTLKASHVLSAMGHNAASAGEVIRVSFGPPTDAAAIDRFMATWQRIAARAAA